MPHTAPFRPGGPCERIKAAAALAEADERCTTAAEGKKGVAHTAYRAAFEVYRKAQRDCLHERMRRHR